MEISILNLSTFVYNAASLALSAPVIFSFHIVPQEGSGRASYLIVVNLFQHLLVPSMPFICRQVALLECARDSQSLVQKQRFVNIDDGPPQPQQHFPEFFVVGSGPGSNPGGGRSS